QERPHLAGRSARRAGTCRGPAQGDRATAQDPGLTEHTVDEAPPPTGAPSSNAEPPPASAPDLNVMLPADPGSPPDASRAGLPSDAPPPGPVTRRRAFLRNLAAGFWLLIPGRRVPPERFVGGFDQIVLLLALTLAVWAGLDRVQAEA